MDLQLETSLDKSHYVQVSVHEANRRSSAPYIVLATGNWCEDGYASLTVREAREVIAGLEDAIREIEQTP